MFRCRHLIALVHHRFDRPRYLDRTLSMQRSRAREVHMVRLLYKKTATAKAHVLRTADRDPQTQALTGVSE